MRKIMNTHKVILNRLLMFLLLTFSLTAFAEEAPFRVFETDSVNIKLAKDGTGIVKGIVCDVCDFNFVKITTASKASINGVDVSVKEARNLVDKVVMVSFNPETQEVQYIRWSN